MTEQENKGIIPSKDMLDTDNALRPAQALPIAPENRDMLTSMYMSVQKTLFQKQAEEARNNPVPVKTRNGNYPDNGPRL